MRVVFTPNGWDDYRHWRTADRATLKRLNRLIDDVCQQRLVYLIDSEDVVILQSALPLLSDNRLTPKVQPDDLIGAFHNSGSVTDHQKGRPVVRDQ
ncbi:MAG: type II toxin-antitoxin system YoeB family toxin [Euzebya sp.]